MRRLRLLPVLALLALLAAACSDDDSSDASPQAAPPESAVADDGPTTTTSEADPPESDAGADTTDEQPADDEPAEAPEAGDPVPDDTTDPADEPVDRDFTAIAPIVEANLDEHALNGAGLVIVDRDDGIVYEQHWGVFGPDRISLIASSSKMITAGVLMHLDDQGLLDVEAPVAEVVDWGAANPDITPAQLVSNSSGLPGLFPDPAYAPYRCQYTHTGTLQECAETIFTSPDDDADVIAPDTEFRYGGAQWQVAGAVAEVASGKTWAELIDEIYVEPCGLETLGYNNHFGQIASGFTYPDGFDGDPSVLEPTDNPNMEGGAYATTGDYARLLLMHLRDGVCGDTRVLSPEALDRMHADRLAEAYAGDARGPARGYGMGWWVQRDTGRIDDPGAYGSYPWLDLDDGYGAYLVVESAWAFGNEIAGELAEVVHAAMTG